MQKKIIQIDEKNGIWQVTTTDERWYTKEIKDPVTGLPTFTYVPSVTWIAGHYPKGVAFYKWLANQGWDDSQALKNAAGNKGSKVHKAISEILQGEEVRINSKYVNNETGAFEELTLEEVDCIMSFIHWRNEYKPTTIAFDVTVFSQKHGYAGTIDYICKIGEDVYIIDFKTSQDVWPEYELQVSAYKQPLAFSEMFIDGLTDVSDIKLAILQIGYRRNKAGYKWNLIEDQFPLFLAARQIWAKESASEHPKQKDYPIILSPAAKREEPAVDQAEAQTTLPLEKGTKKNKIK